MLKKYGVMKKLIQTKNACGDAALRDEGNLRMLESTEGIEDGSDAL